MHLIFPTCLAPLARYAIGLIDQRRARNAFCFNKDASFQEEPKSSNSISPSPKKSWEAERGSEELTDRPAQELFIRRHPDHLQPDSLESTGARRKVNVDSITLDVEKDGKLQPDSLSFDAATFERNNEEEFYDSINNVQQQQRKLIIPYADSYSSNEITTSEESLSNENAKKSFLPRDIRELTLQPMVKLAHASNPDLRKSQQGSPAAVRPASSASALAVAARYPTFSPVPVPSDHSGSSLVRLAKRKFLNWS